jgi:hypothetical protein
MSPSSEWWSGRLLWSRAVGVGEGDSRDSLYHTAVRHQQLDTKASLVQQCTQHQQHCNTASMYNLLWLHVLHSSTAPSSVSPLAAVLAAHVTQYPQVVARGLAFCGQMRGISPAVMGLALYMSLLHTFCVFLSAHNQLQHRLCAVWCSRVCCSRLLEKRLYAADGVWHQLLRQRCYVHVHMRSRHRSGHRFVSHPLVAPGAAAAQLPDVIHMNCIMSYRTAHEPARRSDSGGTTARISDWLSINSHDVLPNGWAVWSPYWLARLLDNFICACRTC